MGWGEVSTNSPLTPLRPIYLFYNFTPISFKTPAFIVYKMVCVFLNICDSVVRYLVVVHPVCYRLLAFLIAPHCKDYYLVTFTFKIFEGFFSSCYGTSHSA